MSELEKLREALRFAIKIVDSLEAEKQPIRVELIFLRAKAEKALGITRGDS